MSGKRKYAKIPLFIDEEYLAITNKKKADLLGKKFASMNNRSHIRWNTQTMEKGHKEISRHIKEKAKWLLLTWTSHYMIENGFRDKCIYGSRTRPIMLCNVQTITWRSLENYIKFV